MEAPNSSPRPASPTNTDLLPAEPESRVTKEGIRSELEKLGYSKKINGKASLADLKSLLQQVSEAKQISAVNDPTIEIPQKGVSESPDVTLDQIYSTPSKDEKLFTGVNPASPTTAAYELLSNPRMVLPGHAEVLHALLDSIQLHDITAMEYLVTIPEYMSDIAAHLSPIGSKIFMRACTPVVSSPSSAVSSPRKSPSSSLRRRPTKVAPVNTITDQMAYLSAAVGKIAAAQSTFAQVKEFVHESPKHRARPHIESTAPVPTPVVGSKPRIGVKAEPVAPVNSPVVNSPALAQIDIEIAACLARRTALQASAAAAILPPVSCPQMEERKAKLAALQTDCAVLEAPGVSPSTLKPTPPLGHNLMLDKIAAASLPIPPTRTPGSYPDDDDDCYDDNGDDDNRDDVHGDEGDSGDEDYYNSKAQSSSIPRDKSLASLQKQAAHDIAIIKDYWKYSSKTTYTDIVMAAETEVGLQVMTVVGGVHTGQFKKSTRDSGKARALQPKEVYGPPGDIQPSKGGLSRDSGEGRIVFPRSYKECIRVLDTESDLLMNPKFRAMDDHTEWLAAFHSFKIAFSASALKLLGSTPDIPQPQGIQKCASMCLFLFRRVQRACSAGDHTILNLDFESGWDRDVRPSVTAALDRDITVREWEAILIARGNVCPVSTCGAAGMTQEVCGVCVKSAVVTSRPPPQWFKKRDAARVVFDTAHPTVTGDKGRLRFNKENPQWVWPSTGETSGPSNRTDALRYIFANQQKIALPFSVA
mmetsp:Transcript_23854/g.22945  ORF Transcript_23854/g.22945 Transcript_23854/m.22945 type:complete len:757 (-) Transcript_23854:386-2656(-)